MFSERLKQLRKQRGITQKELSIAIFVSRSTVCKWEMGNGIPSNVNLESLCTYFNVSEEWLLNREDLKSYTQKNLRETRITFIASLLGILFPLMFIWLSFSTIFYQGKGNPNFIYPMVFNPASIIKFLGGYSIIPMAVYVDTIIYSILNVFNFITNKSFEKRIMTNYKLTGISVITFIISLVICIIIGYPAGWGIF